MSYAVDKGLKSEVFKLKSTFVDKLFLYSMNKYAQSRNHMIILMCTYIRPWTMFTSYRNPLLSLLNNHFHFHFMKTYAAPKYTLQNKHRLYLNFLSFLNK